MHLGHLADLDRKYFVQTARVAAAYDRWAPIYDLVFGAVFKIGRRQAVVAAEEVGGRVLEVGVGTGISLPQYKPETRIVGTDISNSMLDVARKRVKQYNLSNVDDLLVMDAEAMDFGDDAFDVVVAQYVVSAVPNPEKAMDEFLRVVKPGGEIIIATRVGADTGLRSKIEKILMPLTRKLGWRTEFPFSLYADWAQLHANVTLIERRSLPPLGHFSLVRFKKQEG